MSGVAGFLKRLPGERECVATVAKRWRAQYWNGQEWLRTCYGPSREVHKRLLALPPEATAKDVEAIIGNDSWIGHDCDGCGATSTDAWQIGDEPEYQSATVVLCGACMAALVKHVSESAEGQ